MTTLLQIDSSARTARSVTRKLAQTFMDAWFELNPETTLIKRDVGLNPPPAVSESWIAAAFAGNDRTPEQEQLLALSDTLIGEVEAADLIVLSVPMYNYGMPAALKAWFDQVIRINRTFTFDLSRGEQPIAPILTGKQLLILSSCGEYGFEPGRHNEHASHLVPHIRTCAKYLGVTHFEHIGIEYQEFGDARHEQSRDDAFDKVPFFAAKLYRLRLNQAA